MKRLPVFPFPPIFVPEPADLEIRTPGSPASSPCRRPGAGGGPELQTPHSAACGGLRIGKRETRTFGAAIRNLLACLLLVLPFAASAQSLRDFYEEHAARPEFASVSLEPKMMRMMSRRAKEGGDEALAELLDGIEQIRVLVLRQGDRDRFAEEVRRSMEQFGYERLSLSREEGRTTEFYLRESRKRWLPGASGFVMLTCDERETVWMNIYGVFDVRDVGRLSSLRPK